MTDRLVKMKSMYVVTGSGDYKFPKTLLFLSLRYEIIVYFSKISAQVCQLCLQFSLHVINIICHLLYVLHFYCMAPDGSSSF